MSAETPATIGRYEILSKVGEGANGVVYRAQDPTIRRVVALKAIHAEPTHGGDTTALNKVAFFEREAQAAGALLHPNIVTLYDAGRDGDLFYLAMEFIEGGTLAGELARDRRLEPVRAAEVVAFVADALDFAHERGVIHRDVKPANLMVLKDGTVKVADFGIARLASAASTMTSDMVLGTPHYMSPEQVRGGKLDGRSDLFSLGVVLYEFVTGEKPFHAANLAAILNKIMNTSPPPPHEVNPDVPPDLSAIVMRAMARDPNGRYARGKEFASALRAFAQKQRAAVPGTVILNAETAAAGPAIAAAPWRRGLLVGGGLAAFVASLGAAAWIWIGSAARIGYIEASSEIPAVEVFLDGKLVGVTPATFEATSGPHEIEFQKEGYYPEQLTVQVPPDGRVQVESPTLVARTGR